MLVVEEYDGSEKKAVFHLSEAITHADSFSFFWLSVLQLALSAASTAVLASLPRGMGVTNRHTDRQRNLPTLFCSLHVGSWKTLIRILVSGRREHYMFGPTAVTRSGTTALFLSSPGIGLNSTLASGEVSTACRDPTRTHRGGVGRLGGGQRQVIGLR